MTSPSLMSGSGSDARLAVAGARPTPGRSGGSGPLPHERHRNGGQCLPQPALSDEKGMLRVRDSQGVGLPLRCTFEVVWGHQVDALVRYSNSERVTLATG